MNISWMVRSGYPVQLRYRFNLINGTSVWYTAPDLVFNRTGYLVIPPTIHNSTLGNQSILVEAANRLSFIQYKDIGILMYEPVQEISFNYTELSLFQKAKYGFVFQQNIQINFSIITFPGEGILEYTWIFGDGPNITTIIPNTTYTYQTFGEYNLTVIAETCNKLSTTVSIAVHPPIDNVQYNFNESFTGFYNDTLEFNVTANQWGVDGCVYVDCGDGSPVISYCTSQMVNTAGFSVEGKLNATNGLALNFTHVYREPGLFEMIIIANNTVSTERFNRTFNVTAGPCQPPNITMIGKFLR